MSKTQILLLATIFTLVWSVLSVFGQGMGFQLRGPLVFTGYNNGEPVWTIGKELRIQAAPGFVLHKHLRDLEGQEVFLVIQPPIK